MRWTVRPAARLEKNTTCSPVCRAYACSAPANDWALISKCSLRGWIGSSARLCCGRSRLVTAEINRALTARRTGLLARTTALRRPGDRQIHQAPPEEANREHLHARARQRAFAEIPQRTPGP